MRHVFGADPVRDRGAPRTSSSLGGNSSMKRSLHGRLALAATAAVVAALGLTGCVSQSSGSGSASSGGDHGKGRIAFMMPDLVTARWDQQDKPVFEAEMKKACPDCKVTYYNAKGSPETQLAQTQSAITNGVDAVVLAPIDKNAAINMVNQFHQAGVKVISYATIIDTPNVDYGVTTDIFKIGAQQAQSLVDGLKAKGITSGNLIAINGDPSDAFGPKYKAGAHSVLDKSGFTIAAEYDAKNWDGTTAQSQMDQAITKVGKGNFVGVYAANDQLAGGAIAAMKNAGVDPTTILTTGQDGAVAGLQRIIAGEQYNTINLPIKVFAAKTADLAAAVAKGKPAPTDIVNGTTKTPSGAEIKAYLYDTEVITKENVSNMIVPKGFWPLKDVCTPEYQAACQKANLS
ncbi:sugar ABC transporter substrate-binding protein [Planosporangium thailandense]|uniref:Sugar ABC transporter substrate-binding protein n=1 Tax=Planosporangium thailandense TaxID=765197 RepID=A0ABX0XXF3_9ACTN|nr:substrate-binding domain-containing protein [Planosporangium thailandense]NJC69972.1 sugar ABC transporter substrate-binding protein [Planosporangium thailandense]